MQGFFCGRLAACGREQGTSRTPEMRLLRKLYSNRDFGDPAAAIVADVLLVAVVVAAGLYLVAAI